MPTSARAARVPSVGVLFPAQAVPGDVAGFAARAEALGYESLFVVEDCFLSGSVALAAIALHASSRLQVGVGLMPAAARNPAVAAMELATLAEIFPGRLRVAFGHGVETWMAQIGARPADRLIALEETVRAVRGLLRGEVVSTSGRHVQLVDVALDNPPSTVPPVFIGTTGSKTLTVAARCADGLLLPEGCGPSFLRAAGSARPTDPRRAWRTIVYAWLSLDDSMERAIDRLRPAVSNWLAGGLYPGPARAAGVLPGCQPDPGDHGLVRKIAIFGDPAACRAAVGALATAGADEIVLAPQGPDIDAQVARFAREVLPELSLG